MNVEHVHVVTVAPIANAFTQVYLRSDMLRMQLPTDPTCECFGRELWLSHDLNSTVKVRDGRTTLYTQLLFLVKMVCALYLFKELVPQAIQG